MYTKNVPNAGPPGSASRKVYDYLQEEILSGRLPGGSFVRQEEIAKRLSLSRIPVRDALRHLAAEGFVTIESNRQIVVTLLEKDDLRELYEMRAALEGLAARHAVSKLTDSDANHLAWLAESMDRSGSIGDRWLPIHDQLHDIICSASGMPRLIQETRRLRRSLQHQVRLLIVQNGGAELPSSHHRDLVQVIIARNPERAERAIKEHIMEAAAEIISAIDNSKGTRVAAFDGSAIGKTARRTSGRTSHTAAGARLLQSDT
jgi:DNA-binding GntR family transcriptional regulator